MPLTHLEIRAIRDQAEKHEWLDDIRELATRLLAAEAALGQVRTVLASTDIVSLPDDYSTVTMAHDRMDRIKELTLQGLAEIGRREAVEARVKVLEDAVRKLLACPAIADGNHNEAAYYDPETVEAEREGRKALDGK